MENTEVKASNTTYLQKLQQSPSEKEAGEFEYQADSAKLTLNGDILETTKTIRELEKRVEKAMYAVPFDSQAIVSAKSKLEAAQKGLAILEEVKSTLFA